MIFRAQVDKVTEQLRASYWFIPAIMALAAIILAFASVALDRVIGPEWVKAAYFIAPTRPDGARDILTVIGGSMIGVAGTVFSVTMVAVVYASGQFGPRILTNFLSDKGNQFTLGTFTATFLFAILVLGSVQSADEAAGSANSGFVPHISLVLAVVLALCSIAVLIFFIHHVPTRIHISNVIAGIGEALLSAIDKRFPRKIGVGARDRAEAEDAWWQLPAAFHPGADARRGEPDYAEVRATTRGYVQFLDEQTLIDAARDHTVIVRLAIRPGTFLFPGAIVCDVWPAERLTEACRRDLLAAIATGSRRTPADDMLFLVDELVEITARALSPSINDPFTARTCIDWMAAALAELGARETPDPLRTDEDNKLRIVAEPLGFAEYLQHSLGAVRDYVAGDKIALIRFLRSIELVARRCTREADLRALGQLAAQAVETSRSLLEGPSLKEIEAEHKVLVAALRNPRRRRPFVDFGDLSERLPKKPRKPANKPANKPVKKTKGA